MNKTWETWWPELYSDLESPVNYPGSQDSYRRAGAFLAGESLVEEWGCATTFGRQFIPAPYRGIDGASSQFVDIVADLSHYKSDVPRALMRHVLEHNWNWRDILDNFLDSFIDRAVLILFIPTGKHDINRSFEHRSDEPPSPPGLQLDEDSLVNRLSRPGMIVDAIELSNDTPPFGYERLFYLKKTADERLGWKFPAPKCYIDGCDVPAYETVRSDFVVNAFKDRWEHAVNVCTPHQRDIKHSMADLLKPPNIGWEI